MSKIKMIYDHDYLLSEATSASKSILRLLFDEYIPVKPYTVQKNKYVVRNVSIWHDERTGKVIVKYEGGGKI